ncbi:GNAT family N-acetyltransferase [Paenibacillus alkalitolerans]|uniref:GNAT family N-acetyltransferase n=1 Tax=Paenibacillus alkalitolerans TaxID=2799335 RepID=UPI0018F6C255|nr:GNAT family N-acetyltransferase [Paenibacillus alkalitolerans]
MITIRKITTNEVDVYWELRLEALRTSPEAFGGTYEEVVDTPIDAVRSRIGSTNDNYILGAFSESNKIVGMLGFKREQSIKTRHKGFIWGMYVTPSYRKQGVGKSLLNEVLKRSKKLQGLEQITLCVVTSNNHARELYIKSGFEVFGYEKNALKHEGHRYDEEHMVFRLN